MKLGRKAMPEVVERYAANKDLTALAEIYQALTESYNNDVEKYARNSSMIQVIRHALQALPLLAGSRIKFEGFGQSNYRGREIGEALRTLEKAFLLHLVYPTTVTQLPLLPDRRKSPRLHMLDTGLMNYYAGIQPQMVVLKDLDTIHQGRVAEHLAGQEILASSPEVHHGLRFWVREKNQSSAEVDYLLLVNGQIVPVEVKSGASGTLRSLHLLMDALEGDLAIRLYAGPLTTDYLKTPLGKPYRLLNLPYYLAGRLEAYAAWAQQEGNVFK